MNKEKLQKADWCCRDCGLKYGDCKEGSVAVFHNSICDICGEEKSITQTRDYNYLRKFN
jgi:hypothetical protein